MSCRFILIRHGESEGNHQERFLGHTDLDLTEKGHMQAECTANYLKDTHIDAIYASDLKRAWSTAEHIADKHDLSIIADSEFREVYAGEWEGMKYVDINEKYPELFKLWRTCLGKAYCVDGESVRDVYARVLKELLRLADMYEGQTVCIATHATPVRALRTAALKLDLDEARPVGPSNASVTIIDVKNGELTLVADGYDEHLRDIFSMPDV